MQILSIFRLPKNFGRIAQKIIFFVHALKVLLNSSSRCIKLICSPFQYFSMPRDCNVHVISADEIPVMSSISLMDMVPEFCEFDS